MIKAILGILLGVLLSTEVLSDPRWPYRESARIKHIAKVLKAIQGIDQSVLEQDRNWAQSAKVNLCDTELLSIKISCLTEATVDYCREKYEDQQRDQCILYMDMFLVNSLNETSFISRKEKYHILKNSSFRKNILQERLQYRYGELATEFAMSEFFVCGLEREACFAAGIDSFCRTFSDQGRLPFQACVGALISFTSFQFK